MTLMVASPGLQLWANHTQHHTLLLSATNCTQIWVQKSHKGHLDTQFPLICSEECSVLKTYSTRKPSAGQRLVCCYGGHSMSSISNNSTINLLLLRNNVILSKNKLFGWLECRLLIFSSSDVLYLKPMLSASTAPKHRVL